MIGRKSRIPNSRRKTFILKEIEEELVNYDIASSQTNSLNSHFYHSISKIN